MQDKDITSLATIYFGAGFHWAAKSFNSENWLSSTVGIVTIVYTVLKIVQVLRRWNKKDS